MEKLLTCYFAASVPQVPECHGLVDTRTSELDSEGHLVSFYVRRFGRRGIHWVLFDCFAVCMKVRWRVFFDWNALRGIRSWLVTGS